MRWIVVDGIDGSGKNTHAMTIKDYYERKGESVLILTHPSDRWAGRMTRRALRREGKIMQLLAGVFFVLDVLCSLSRRRIWRNYDTVVMVRYLLATAYLPGRFAHFAYEFFRKLLPVPSRLLLVDTEPAIALERIRSRNQEMEIFETPSRLEEVRRRMLSIAGDGWRVLDNSSPFKYSERQLFLILSDWDSRNGDDRLC